MGIIFDGKTGEKIGKLSIEDGHKGSIYAVSWSSDSTKVTCKKTKRVIFSHVYFVFMFLLTGF